ncbi:bifunctional diaminohydroxyphosphoribosylaminopyrimidine deaminase/5-amino-6-(5-phosphoribosylamino)uracil reductase RibD [Corynebacterium uropygiale]|uniref:Riboflavin biosynthesis protein RibD n=1 Tax=Corynebacterium uropygiale TaxID=1775911 RepID=A0A9X1QRM9_9CORY|nr:bifunctional diaminohydroxyphosphoribosylaminopyrimidine deaminase/5-amino-6-(5-phosphoribosylamino)uracil reductase RibD [Corynebacterium uropygiale]MCF4006578.1 bifunctional diaminohydroxyphosphoribosylaminopyrimidine deaminase/5-amino-6-(5-phosphoribosylamino)uracil reductase RibD [Corynebacterium uropygiale]
MTNPPTVMAALEAAIAASEQVVGTTSPNPPVGAAILSAEGELVGVGATQPPGGPHAEVMALRAAGERARGGTAVVTLEPCHHVGRTGPCSHALLGAGIRTLYYAHEDATPPAAGGAEWLRQQGMEVHRLDVEVPTLRPWLRAMALGRPHVTLKCAQTLDGFTAAPDGTSQWITGLEARAWVHRDRARRDAIIIGTGTALADNPSLTARTPEGELLERQPRRVVIGRRSLDPERTSNLHRLGFEQYDSPAAALAALWEEGARDVLVDGGAGLLTSFLEEGLADALQVYVAPLLLGEGRGTLCRPLARTLAEATRLHQRSLHQVGEDILWELTLDRDEERNPACSPE